ncbi:hypothetical protein K438DRAFT_2016518 [Mycena galopus ATCC 62051]|nr:hypothetical protein K438DRAFT_2016518 [Mycena galopus ATCC 62051]
MSMRCGSGGMGFDPEGVALAALRMLLVPFVPLSPNTVTYISSLHPASVPQQLYAKGPALLALLAWLLLLFSLLRLIFNHHLFLLVARRWGISKRAKVGRFGEQGYQVVYFSVVRIWGMHNMLHSRTGWFGTRAFWAAYPHTHLPAPLNFKAYYLAQIAYRLQQVCAGIRSGAGEEAERPLRTGRTTCRYGADDYKRGVCFLKENVSYWRGENRWGYVMNVTLRSNAVLVSMDVPDVLLAVSALPTGSLSLLTSHIRRADTRYEHCAAHVAVSSRCERLSTKGQSGATRDAGLFRFVWRGAGA